MTAETGDVMTVLAKLALQAALLAGGSAHADCAPLLDALERAQRQPRGAVYEVDRRDQPPSGQPSTIRIGKAIYENSNGVYERYDTDGTDPTLAAIRGAQKAGRWNCQAVGSDSYRGKATARFRFDNPLLPSHYNPTTMWIDAATGLPVYHEVNGLGGYAWVYGDAVKEPRVKR
jgi:hypothetical protein